MKYFLKERIGNPDLFTGRREELKLFLKWIDDIKGEKSKSTAILARRKMGKSALLERLFNITASNDKGIIPFYFEIKDTKKWSIDFSKEYFLSFIYQYIAFKSKNRRYIARAGKDNFQNAVAVARKEGLDYLVETIEEVEHAATNESVDSMWEMVRNAPRLIAECEEEFILQIIDEFQFLNRKIYRDKECTNLMDDLAGSYLNTAESKISPLIVSGSWVGWLMDDLIMQLPARFKFVFLKNMPEDEAIEMIVKYSQYFEVPVTEDVIYQIFELTDGSPFYISSIIRSNCPKKDLTTTDGLLGVLEFETLNYGGEIKSTWMEYVTAAFNKVNDRNAKNIVLYLCKNREREVTRKEIQENLNLDINDIDLEKRLRALVMADIISQGSSNFDYQGIKDNIFDKVFRGVYQKEIEVFDDKIITNEYKRLLEDAKKRYNQLLGKYNYQKGYFAEFLIMNQLKSNVYKNSKTFKLITNNLPKDFDFPKFKTVRSYKITQEASRELDVDIFAEAESNGYSLIIEVKNRKTKKFSIEEAEEFQNKIDELRKIEHLERSIGLVFSRSGFTKNSESYCLDHGIAFSCDEKWLD